MISPISTIHCNLRMLLIQWLEGGSLMTMNAQQVTWGDDPFYGHV
jgi:hypothetical protein